MSLADAMEAAARLDPNGNRGRSLASSSNGSGEFDLGDGGKSWEGR